MWLPREEEIITPYEPKLELLSKTELGNNTLRMNFQSATTDHASVFIQPLEDVIISNWSLPTSYIGQQDTSHMYFSYGKNNTALTFFIDFYVSARWIDMRSTLK